MPKRFDVVICGGGTAGCVVAARLSERREHTVCLVEAGPDYGPYPSGRWPADLLDGRTLALSHSWATERDDRSQLRARVIGGCSAHNACAVLEADPADYDAWGPGWSYADLKPHLDRAREQLRARSLLDQEVSPWHRAFLKSSGDNAVLYPLNAVGTVRWNAAFAYLDPARERPNLTILADRLVDRVEPGRVITSQGELAASLIVLAAGAYGSPAILLRSRLDQELPVGEGLADHVGVGFAWEGTSLLQQETDRFAATRPVFMGHLAVRAGGGDLFIFPAIEAGARGWEPSAAVFLMKPASRGRVSLTSQDPHAPLHVEHGFLSDPADAERLTEGVETLRTLTELALLRRHTGRELRPGPGVDDATHIRSTARGFFHPTGTCAMGRVVDLRGRLLGVDGIVVADASIMPTVPRVPVNLTVAAVAEKIAETL